MPSDNDFLDFETFRPVMTREEIFAWFQRRLSRTPEADDFYIVAKQFYNLGAYSRAMLCLQQYVTMPGAGTHGRHLLGYCYLSLNQNERALREFKRCVKEGQHEDWQLVVELTIEMEGIRKLQRENFDGFLAHEWGEA